MGVFFLHTSAALEVQNRVQFTWAKFISKKNEGHNQRKVDS